MKLVSIVSHEGSVYGLSADGKLYVYNKSTKGWELA